MNNKNIIICFCKHPVSGLVKSRLAHGIGDENAAKTYRILLDETMRNVHLTKIETYLYCHPNSNHPVLKNYNTLYDFNLRSQSKGNLGNKMYQAIKNHLNKNENVVLIGTDCIEIDTNYLLEAFVKLEQGNDIVLGPTEDGGYALIGLSKVNMSIFEDIAWSTDQVFKRTVEKISDLHWKFTALSTVS